MKEEELKVIILNYLESGSSLAEIQTLLQEKHSYDISYRQLRILSSEIEFSWQDDSQEIEEKKDSDIQAQELEKMDPTIEVSRVVKPGSVVHGEFEFSSSEKGQWAVNNMGQLELFVEDEKILTIEQQQSLQKNLQIVLKGEE